MVSGAKLQKLSEPGDNCPMTFEEMLKQITCDVPDEDCYFQKCKKCPDFKNLEKIL